MLNARSWAPGGAGPTRPGPSNPGSLGVMCSDFPAPLFTVASGVRVAVPFWVRGREAGTAAVRTPRSVPRRQLFSGAAVGGSRGDGDRCGSPSPGQKWEDGLRGLFPGWKPPPPPEANPPERPSRRRVCRRKRPETVRFHAASGARVPEPGT